MQHQRGKANGARSLEVIDRQVRQLVRLVDDLLDVSRITHGRIELRRQRTLLAPLLATAVETVLPQMEAMAHRLKIDVPTEPISVDGDPQRLTQVFGNLLNNACKYTSAGGAIELVAHVEEGTVIVSIRDNGVGIPLERLDEVFDLFVQVDTSLERAQGGLGIGLTLVRRLVEMHGGTVKAYSAGPGEGSRFEVKLPLAREADMLQTGAYANKLPSPDGGRRRILVVDDNRDAADTLAVSLNLWGHEVQAIYDPMRALETIAQFVPDIAFLDVGMPKLNGLELASMIRAHDNGRAILLVALTGWGQEDDRRRSQQAGFDYHLVKPADPAEIERICRIRERPTVT
jgi:CheY-like chemotaxis protein